MLQSFKFCQLLAASLTELIAADHDSEGALQSYGVQHLSALTNLTKLGLTGNGAVGNLTELKHLRQLHTLSLMSCMEVPLCTFSLTNIQKLILCRGKAQTVNLSYCTQLTSLSLNVSSRLQTVALPQGDSVQLCSLHMTSEESINPQLVMSNLSCASRLVTLDVDSIHPSNLRRGDWPLCMPEL